MQRDIIRALARQASHQGNAFTWQLAMNLFAARHRQTQHTRQDNTQ